MASMQDTCKQEVKGMMGGSSFVDGCYTLEGGMLVHYADRTKMAKKESMQVLDGNGREICTFKAGGPNPKASGWLAFTVTPSGAGTKPWTLHTPNQGKLEAWKASLQPSAHQAQMLQLTGDQQKSAAIRIQANIRGHQVRFHRHWRRFFLRSRRCSPSLSRDALL
jgi:hypothetical protein